MTRVLLIHGLLNADWWLLPLAARLRREGFTPVRFGYASVRGGPGQAIPRLAQRLHDGDVEGVVGHSLGGLVAARAVALRRVTPDALVLSSPALASGMRRDQRWLAALLAHIAPGFTIANGLDTSRISHEAAEVVAYRSDPQVHDRISGRLAHFIATSGPPTMEAARDWQVPTLLLFAGDDHLVDAEGSRRFAAAASPGVVQAREFAGLYHELFNEREPDRGEVFGVLCDWLEAQCPRDAGGVHPSQ